MNVVGEVEGRDCILADDMIDTAGTVTEAARALKGLGANDIYVCATHALLQRPGRRAPEGGADQRSGRHGHDRSRRRNAGSSGSTILSVGELLSKAIRYTHAEQSVSSLFD